MQNEDCRYALVPTLGVGTQPSTPERRASAGAFPRRAWEREAVAPRAVSPRVRNEGVAQQKRASSSPSRFSRTASLLYQATTCPRGRSTSKRKINSEKPLREKSSISSGGIIGILGHGIKVGWRGKKAA
jgi:hypothetical protein